jgi:hypothetical protein
VVRDLYDRVALGLNGHPAPAMHRPRSDDGHSAAPRNTARELQKRISPVDLCVSAEFSELAALSQMERKQVAERTDLPGDFRTVEHHIRGQMSPPDRQKNALCNPHYPSNSSIGQPSPILGVVGVVTGNSDE